MMTSRILVYCANSSPRFKYIAEYFLEKLCGSTIAVTSDPVFLNQYQGPSICYDEVKLSPRSIHVKPYGLLSQEGISSQENIMGVWGQWPCFFLNDGDIPFDIFSASFFLVTRYEEYLPHQKDIYGRYAHTNSLAFKASFLDIPLLNLWAIEFKKLLPEPGIGLPQRSFNFIPSYDIDMAWAYRHKGLLRNTGNMLKLFISGDWERIRKRFDVLRGTRQDPFDVYEWLDALHLKFSLKPFYFFLVAEKNSKYDKNIPPSNEAMGNLIEYHARGYKTGIHPSWQSWGNENLFDRELAVLSSLTGHQVEYNRFHYIAFSLPDDYRKLLKKGIKSDFSMGYGSINGFRASVSTPFAWYDLERDQETDLTIHPFCWMDANSYYEQLYTPAKAFAELKKYHDVVKSVGGQLMTISHNNFFSDEPGFAGWKEVYEIFLEEVVYWDL